MKVYDIALAFVRTLVALDLIRELGVLLFAGVRATLVGSNPELRGLEMASIASAVWSILVLLLAFALSKPIARFASKLAVPTDTAAHF
jgi:hypothetical protein